MSEIIFFSFPFHSPGENPHIIEHPMDTTVPKNDPYTFNCKADGNPTPTIQWFKDGRELKTDAGSHRIMLPAGGLFFLKVSSDQEIRNSIIIMSCLSPCIIRIRNSMELLPIDVSSSWETQHLRINLLILFYALPNGCILIGKQNKTQTA